ncbi:MAG: 4,5-DOPA dioxygenase extradiol [Caulobacteraceae bacterium]
MPGVRMPALFIGHGTPMNALEDNDYTRIWRDLGRRLPRPKAILAVSAHWETRGTAVTAAAMPSTIHDFGGFPQALFDVQYPAPGSMELVERVKALLGPTPVGSAQDWGLDHGAWSVLVHMYPDADVPVVQLSLDMTLSGEAHFELAAKLRPLRDEGVLILGTGNIVHNLRAMDRSDTLPPYDWAVRFDTAIKTALVDHDYASILAPGRFGQDAQLSIQGPEHYIPLIYVIAQQADGEPLRLFSERLCLRSCSMTSVIVGDEADALLAAA